MSSPFEGPPQDSRIFSAPAQPSRPWTKMIAAFAAGMAFTFLIVTFFSATPPASQPETKASQRTQSPRVAKTHPPAEPTKADAAAGATQDTSVAATASLPEPSSKPADTPASAAVDASDAAAKQARDACAQQTWPYVSHECGGTDSNADQTTRAVRVIPTDRSAPSSVVTAVPPTPPGRSTDGAAPKKPSAATEKPVPLTTDGVPAPPAGRAQELAGAPAEQPQLAGSDGATAAPMPKPKSDSAADAKLQPAPEEPPPAAAAAGKQGAAEATKQDPVTPASAIRDTRETRRSDRSQSRRDDRRREREKVIGDREARPLSEELARAPSREAGRTEESARRAPDATRGRETFTRSSQEEPRYVREESARLSRGEERRGREETTRAPSRETRRALEEPRRKVGRSREELTRGYREEQPRSARTDDEDDHVVVRTRRAPDGRRVTLRIEETRSAVPAEGTARPKLPFFLNIFDLGN
jgi:hypothetical protein